MLSLAETTNPEDEPAVDAVARRSAFGIRYTLNQRALSDVCDTSCIEWSLSFVLDSHSQDRQLERKLAEKERLQRRYHLSRSECLHPERSRTE